MAVDRDSVEEEYNIWRKNVPYIYDLMISTELEKPPKTIEWLPGVEERERKHTAQRMILGTDYSNEPNYLFVSQIRIPTENNEYDAERFDELTRKMKRFGTIDGEIEYTARIPHNGEVREARYMPQESCFIATRNPKNQVCVFDYEQFTEESTSFSPLLTLHSESEDQTVTGGGLVWNPQKKGTIAAASTDGRICVWDIRTSPLVKLHSGTVLRGHERVVYDIDWHHNDENVVFSVGADKKLKLSDVRSGVSSNVYQDPHTELTRIAFNPASDFLIVFAGRDDKIRMIESRHPQQLLHTFPQHPGPVTRLRWCPDKITWFASCSGNRLHVWDVKKIGTDQPAEDDEDGPPELMFVHGGHREQIIDCSWNPNEEYVMCSVSTDHVVQVWQMSSAIFNP